MDSGQWDILLLLELKTYVIMDIIGYVIFGIVFINEISHLIVYSFKIFSKEDYETLISNCTEKEMSDNGRRIFFIGWHVGVISVCKDASFLCPYSVYTDEKIYLIWRFSPVYKKMKKEFEDNRKLKSKS